MKAAFYTLGCKVNQYDTQMMSEKLVAAGHEIVEFDETADVYIINTCTVTQVSDKKSRNVISKARRKNTDAVIVVCGCLSQVSPEETAAIDGVDVVIGTRNRADILYYINEYLKTGKQIVDIESSAPLEKENITNFSEKTRAIIKIEDGCRNFCSYCLIPFARGKIVSKPVSQIVSEAEAVSAHGYKEVVLTGIHLSSYGVDLSGSTLADAIEAVSSVSGIERIRLGSLEPTIITPEFAERISNIDKLCPAFHLSLQSGCDKTLKAMNRKYTAFQYAESVANLRRYFKDCAVTTDVIVGFPGESDADFMESCDFIEKIGFSKIHIFPYSKRRGTKAALMEDQLSKAVKRRREKILMETEQKCRYEFLTRFIGRSVRVLAEQCENGVCSGFTDSYVQVKFVGDESLCNTFADVRVNEICDNYLYGTLN